MPDQNDMGEVDVGALVADMGNLWSDDAPPPAPAPAGTPAAAPAAPTPSTTPPVSGPKPMPKAWKKEMEALWGQLPADAHEYIHAREADVSRGIQTYRDGHERWSRLLTPFQQVLQQYPDVDPVGLMQNLMQTHLTLALPGDNAKKRELVSKVLASYGIDLTGAAPSAPPAVDPALLQRVDGIERTIQTEKYQTALNQVTAFFNDPTNEYAKELELDVLEGVKRGLDLKTAYEQAQWLNPAVRAKLIAKQTAPAPGAAALNVNAGSNGSRPPPAPRKGSIDDTIDSVISKHYPSNPH